MEKYLVIEPSGEVYWINVVSELRRQTFCGIIGCDCLENVHTVFNSICLVIDESGKVKPQPQLHNELASSLYLGYLYGKDNIAGPAILVGLESVPPYGELDWCSLSAVQLDALALYGIPVPDVDKEG